MAALQLDLGNVTHHATLAALRKVPRHLFVPAALQRQAYADHPLPIGHGQTISQPYLVACMTELIAPTRTSRVLEIGTGSGYQTAILAEICAEVFTMELLPDLAGPAVARLHELGYRNIRSRTGDGWHGWPTAAPFNAIIVTAAADHIPGPLVDQLADDGRLVLPVGPRAGPQDLLLVTKARGQVCTKTIFGVRFVPLVHPPAEGGNRPRGPVTASGSRHGPAAS